MPLLDYIKISELNDLTTLASDDFIPIVQSSSLTTYRTSIGTFNSSLSVESASYASASTSASYTFSSSNAGTSSYSISASWALSSSYSISASWALSSSYAFSSSNSKSSSYAISASWALSSSYAFSSSYSFSGSYSDTCTSASYASASTSASYASTSFTASHAITAAFALSTGGTTPPPVPGIGGINPIGTIIDWAGYSPTALESDGWMLCDGRSLLISDTQYTNLYNALGGANNPWGVGTTPTTYPGYPGSGIIDGGTKFLIPNLSKRSTYGTTVTSPTITNISSSVGSLGGTENLVGDHWHYIGSVRDFVFGNAFQIFLIWDGTGVYNVYGNNLEKNHSSNIPINPNIIPTANSRIFSIAGNAGDPMTFYPDNSGLGTWEGYNEMIPIAWDFVTTKAAYTKGGGVASGNKLVPPYALTHKLIRWK